MIEDYDYISLDDDNSLIVDSGLPGGSIGLRQQSESVLTAEILHWLDISHEFGGGSWSMILSKSNPKTVPTKLMGYYAGVKVEYLKWALGVLNQNNPAARTIPSLRVN